MPHGRLRFAWILPPRAVRLPRRCVRQERQPSQKGQAPTPSPCMITSDIGRIGATEPEAKYSVRPQRASGPPQTQSGPKSPKELRAARALVIPESENSLPRSSSLGRRLNCSVCGLASGAPVFIPRRFATIWFTSVSAASRLNRGSTSCSAHRRATAMWTGHAIGLVSPIENDQFSSWRRQYRKRFSSAQEAN